MKGPHAHFFRCPRGAVSALRAAGRALTWHASEWSSTPASASLHGLRGRLPDGERRPAGLLPRLDHHRGARDVPAPRHGDPQRALQPLRQPALRSPAARPARATSRSPAARCRSRRASASAARHASPPARTARAMCTRSDRNPKGYVDKCTFCLHRVKDGKTRPACRCARRNCMYFGDLDDPQSK